MKVKYPSQRGVSCRNTATTVKNNAARSAVGDTDLVDLAALLGQYGLGM
jgi:hypothetical protein